MGTKSETLKATLWMIGAMVPFSLMAIAGRELANSLNKFEIMLYRSMISLMIVVLVEALMGTLSEIKINCLELHLVRNLAHFPGQNLWFLVVAFIPSSQFFALEFSTPI